MTLSAIPPHLLARAAEMPENRHAAEALKRAAGTRANDLKPKRSKRRGEMNALERRSASEVLDQWMLDGQAILNYEFEAVTWRAAGMSYTPDFLTRDEHGNLTMIEVKGKVVHAASIVRIKIHAEVRPWMRWVVFQLKGGQWRVYWDSRKESR